MKHEGDSSILKSLAVAFGDGLAFGVGVKIAQASARKRAENAPVAAPVPATPAESLDLQMLSKVFASVDAKLAQHTARIEQRLADSNSTAQTTLEEIHAAMSGRVDSVEQELETRIQAAIESYVDSRIQALEQRLHGDITAAGDRTAKLLVDTIETRLLERIALLQAEVRRQGETVQKLRTASAGSEQRLHDLLEGIHRACRQVVGTDAKPSDDTGPGGAPGASQEPAAAEAPVDDHRFDSLKLVNWQARNERKLPIPLVSSLAVFILGMLAAAGSF